MGAVRERWGQHLQVFDARNNQFMCGPRPGWRLEQRIFEKCVPFECGVHLGNTSIGQPCRDVLPQRHEIDPQRCRNVWPWRLSGFLNGVLRPDISSCVKRFHPCSTANVTESLNCCSAKQDCFRLEDKHEGSAAEDKQISVCQDSFVIPVAPGTNAQQVWNFSS